MTSYYYLIFINQLFVVVYGANDITVVPTTYGNVKGRIMMSTHERLFLAFSGIPYALPPVGKLRFKPPRPPNPWKGIRDATNERSVCPQLILGTEEYIGEEDCLYLNVYAHQMANSDPVIVWIHSGGFHGGNGGMKANSPKDIMNENILFISLNYRLGALGFLSTGDEYLPGNYGLKDQVMALKWIQANIETFGGNPKKVTIYGGQAGATSTQLHVLSPLSSNLFNRVVFHSGSSLTFWMYQRNPARVIEKVANIIGCPTDSSKNMVDCISETSAEALVRTRSYFPYNSGLLPTPFLPVKEYQSNTSSDPPFLTDHPLKLLKSGYINHVPTIAGHYVHYTLDFVKFLMQNASWLQYLNENFTELMRIIIQIDCITDSELMKIRHFYFGNTAITNSSYSILSVLFADLVSVHGTLSGARFQAMHSIEPVYYFEIDFSKFPQNRYRRPEALGTTLTNVGYTLKRPRILFPEEHNPDVLRLQRIGKIFSDFSDTGNPTPKKSKLLPVTWLPLRRTGLETIRYLQIGNEVTMVEISQEQLQRMLFWESVLVNNQDVFTHGCPLSNVISNDSLDFY